MPTKHKAQLDHVGFDWIEDAHQIHLGLTAKEPELLEALNFYEYFGDADPDRLALARHEVLNVLHGILCHAAAIRMDAGYKPVSRLIASLEAVKRDPSLVRTRAIEPEALGVLALHYQRDNEAAGTFWWDVEPQGRAAPERVVLAAANAILALRSEAKPGRRPEHAAKFIALRARELFLEYNVAITRHSVASSRFGKDTQAEGGPFFDFVELFVDLLNRFLSRLSKGYGAGAVCAATVTRMAVDLSADDLQFRRPRFTQSVANSSSQAT